MGKRGVFGEGRVSVEKRVGNIVSYSCLQPLSMVYDGLVVLFVSLTHLHTYSIFPNVFATSSIVDVPPMATFWEIRRTSSPWLKPLLGKSGWCDSRTAKSC